MKESYKEQKGKTMKNDELIITSEGYFNNAHLGFSGLPQICEGGVSVCLNVTEAAFEQFLERTNLTEESKKYITAAMSETKTLFSEIPYAVRVNFLVGGDVTASMNVDANSDKVGVRLSDAEKERLKRVFDTAYSKDFPPLEHALLEAGIGREVPPLTLKNCYSFTDWTPIDADNGEMLIHLSPSLTDLENMVRRTPLWEQNYIQEMFSETETETDLFAGDDIEVYEDIEAYAYIKPDDTVRVEIQPVQFVDGEKFTYGAAAALPLTVSEQRRILDAVNIELAKNNILFRMFDKKAEELNDLLCAKINGEYDNFISHMRTETTAVAIESAYEIVWKDNINEYCSNEPLELTLPQYIALLSSENTLEDIYERFLKNEYANSYRDISIVLEDTADTLLPFTKVIIKEEKCRLVDVWQMDETTYLIGQSVDDMSFHYARATDGQVTRDYGYDHEPSREKVMSDHADKLAEEDIDLGEAIYGADGYLAFPDPDNAYLIDNIKGEDVPSDKAQKPKCDTERG